MALETATYIDGLVATNPAGGDAIAQADDHLRLIKSTLKSTFPNIAGAMTASHTDLNTRLVPSGAIIMWSGAQAAIPSGWVLCNGANGTPDLRNRFVMGAGGAYAVGATGGNTSVTLSESNLPSHTHGATSSFTGYAMAGHSHNIYVTDPGHSHSYSRVGTNGPYYQTTIGTGVYDQNLATYSTNSATTGISATAAASSAGTPSGFVSTSISATGSGIPVQITNPYYALCFIMKV